MKRNSLFLLMMLLSLALFGQPEETNSILYKSMDGGQSWAPSGNGLPIGDRVDVILKEKNIVFALTESHGLYRSDDLGENWYQPGLSMVLPRKVDALVAHQGWLFAGTYRNGVYVSADQGNSWVTANKGLTNLTIRTFVSVGDRLLVGTNDGVFSTKDKGKNWAQLSVDMQINSFCQLEGLLLAATNRGILQSKDGGQNWNWAKQGVAYRKLSVSNGRVYASTFGPEIVKFIPDTKVWTNASMDFPPNSLHTSVLYADELLTVVAQEKGLYLSHDKGSSWQPILKGLPQYAIYRDLFAVGPNVLLLGIGLKREENE